MFWLFADQSVVNTLYYTYMKFSIIMYAVVVMVLKVEK